MAPRVRMRDKVPTRTQKTTIRTTLFLLFDAIRLRNVWRGSFIDQKGERGCVSAPSGVSKPAPRGQPPPRSKFDLGRFLDRLRLSGIELEEVGRLEAEHAADDVGRETHQGRVVFADHVVVMLPGEA